MSEDDGSASAGAHNSRDKESTLLLTKDGQRYYVTKGGAVDSRTVVTPHDADGGAYDADDGDDGDGDGDGESDMLDTSDPRDSAASPEELNDEDASEQGDSSNSNSNHNDGGSSAPKQCTYEGCGETTTQVAKQRKPWMCKKHRNKMYKDKYKKKKSDQALSSSGKLDESSEERPVSVNKQRLGNVGDRPARPSLIEQVLNQKRLSLLRSPEVISFLQQQQRLLITQSRSQSQPDFPGC